uniref:Secreted protein n=1 Tax=Salix viminalis TaxID=40686 RepID=A0A6N2LJP9_SALVM
MMWLVLRVLSRLCKKLLFCPSSSLSFLQVRDGLGGLFFYMGHLELESHTWPRLLQLKQTPLFSVFLPQIWFQSGWVRVKSLFQTFSKWPVKVLLQSFSSMK